LFTVIKSRRLSPLPIVIPGI